MESLFVLMLAFTAILLCFAVPRMCADWLSLHNLDQADEFDELKNLRSAAHSWALRHFFCALMAFCMAMAIDHSSLEARAPHLLQMTTVYACTSLILAFVETLFAQKITVLLSTRKVAVRCRTEELR
ncbi:MAG: hypothetical protein FIB02_07425 [Desulfuromonas sp.]|nr:hypothetical protein [Desulfuromonas sp.]